MAQSLEGLDRQFADFFAKVRDNVSSTVTSVDSEKMESLYRQFRQSMREKLSADPDAASQVKQPEVDSALLELYQLRESYLTLNRLAKAHADAMKVVNETEQALAKWFNENATKHPPQTRLTENLRILADHYTLSSVERKPLIQSLEGFSEHTSTFLYKGIEDTWDTARKQEASRLEYEGFLIKFSQYQDRAKRFFGGTTRTVPNTEEEMANVQDSKASVDHALYQTVQAKKKYMQLSKDVQEKWKLLQWATQTSMNDQINKLILARGAVLNRVGIFYGNNRLAPSNAPVMNQGDWIEADEPSLNRSSATNRQYYSNSSNNGEYPDPTPIANNPQSSSPHISEHPFNPSNSNNMSFVSPGNRHSEDGGFEGDDNQANYNAGIPSIYKQRTYSSWK